MSSDEEDREAILARRNRLIAIALATAGLASTPACGGAEPQPEPCLSQAVPGDEEPQPEVQTPPTEEPPPTACLSQEQPDEPPPQPCLSPPMEPDDEDEDA